MELKNHFLTGLVSKILTKIIKKKTGLDATIDLTYLKIDTEPFGSDGKELMTVNLTMTAYCYKEDFKDFIFKKEEE